jgi:hypothetical protein
MRMPNTRQYRGWVGMCHRCYRPLPMLSPPLPTLDTARRLPASQPGASCSSLDAEGRSRTPSVTASSG